MVVLWVETKNATIIGLMYPQIYQKEAGYKSQKSETLCLEISWAKKIDSIRGEYFLRKLNSHDLEKVKTENREIEFTIWRKKKLGLLETI